MRLECPFCGVRDETEFRYGGEADVAYPAADADDEQWAAYLYFRENRKGVQAELWCHARGCGQWFRITRDTATHRTGPPSGNGPEAKA
ncbi:MAG TPA: sarcosine oxidase subunit delta [Steroidobacteraceae bacterium]|nr:sarcosine oxidase subunit delta [Steroidobacteraceae bacterium]